MSLIIKDIYYKLNSYEQISILINRKHLSHCQYLAPSMSIYRYVITKFSIQFDQSSDYFRLIQGEKRKKKKRGRTYFSSLKEKIRRAVFVVSIRRVKLWRRWRPRFALRGGFGHICSSEKDQHPKRRRYSESRTLG